MRLRTPSFTATIAYFTRELGPVSRTIWLAPSTMDLRVGPLSDRKAPGAQPASRSGVSTRPWRTLHRTRWRCRTPFASSGPEGTASQRILRYNHALLELSSVIGRTTHDSAYSYHRGRNLFA